MGEVDFHLLAAAGDRVHGQGSEGEGEESIFSGAATVGAPGRGKGLRARSSG